MPAMGRHAPALGGIGRRLQPFANLHRPHCPARRIAAVNRGGSVSGARLEEGQIPPELEDELARGGHQLRFMDPVLEARFRAQSADQARRFNRVTIPIMVVMFDLFFLTELQSIPEIVRLSAVFRFALLTPLTALFVLLDWRGKLGGWTPLCVTGLAILLTVLAALEQPFITSQAALPNIQAVLLIQLAVLIWRMPVRHAVIVAICSCAAFIAGVSNCPVVPADFLASLILTDIGVGVAVVAFACRLDLRDRQVFLLAMESDFRRATLARQNASLVRLSHIDALTGIANRRCFDEALAAAWQIAAHRQSCVGLVMFDIDHFKIYNDTLGHPAGDACLRVLAQAVAACLRSNGDTLARYGGEEFAVVLPGASLNAASAVAERIRQAVVGCALPHPTAPAPGFVSISLGVASLHPGLLPPAALIQAADKCLYAAKRQGRNRVATALAA